MESTSKIVYKDNWIIHDYVIETYTEKDIPYLYELSTICFPDETDPSRYIILDRSILDIRQYRDILKDKDVLTSIELAGLLNTMVRPMVDEVLMIRSLADGKILYSDEKLLELVSPYFYNNSAILVEWLNGAGSKRIKL